MSIADPCIAPSRSKPVALARARVFGPAAFAAAACCAPAHAQFGQPARLNQTGGYGWASSGIDAAGSATAVWASSAGITFSTHHPGGSWSAPASFAAGTTINPALHVAASGLATVVTYDASNVWAVDRPAGGNWGAPVPLVSGLPLGNPYAPGVKPVLFLQDTAGDSAIVYRGGAGYPFIYVMRRPAGGTWQQAEGVAVPQSYYVTLSSAAIGDGGDVVVTWGNHDVVCTFRGCHDENFTIQAATEHAAGGGFLTSPVLLTYPDYIVRSAVDAKGHAVVLAQSPASQSVDALVQSRPGAAWSSAATAYGSLTYRPQLSSLTVGGRALATAIVFNPDISSGNVSTVAGTLATNAWTGAINLSLADPAPALVAPQVAGSAPGGTVAAWLDADGTIRASTKKTAAAPWPATQTITAPAPGADAACAALYGAGVLASACNMVLAPSMNAKGRAVLLYQQMQPDGSTPLFAVTN